MESARLGVVVGENFDSLAPPRAQLLAYRAAEWGGFGFGVVGTFFPLTPLPLRLLTPIDYQRPFFVYSSAESESLGNTTTTMKIMIPSPALNQR